MHAEARMVRGQWPPVGQKHSNNVRSTASTGTADISIQQFVQSTGQAVLTTPGPDGTMQSPIDAINSDRTG